MKQVHDHVTTVACLGPRGTFSHIAARHLFGSDTPLFTSSIREIFSEVDAGAVAYGVVPIENSLNGLVYDTLDSFLDFPVEVLGSTKMEIHHNLLARTTDRSRIHTIRTHVQPLGQCKEWLRKNMPQATLEPQESTTKAMAETTDPGVAFIGSTEAAKEYGLQILTANIEDRPGNTTEFYVIGKSGDTRLRSQLAPTKTALILAVYDRPGVLRDILDAFAAHTLNLSKLHSRNSSVGAGDYYFFLEIESLPDDERFRDALSTIKKLCSMVHIIGTP